MTSDIFASSLTGSTISFTNLSFSTLTISTVTANVIYPISMVGSSIRTEMLSASTILTVSTGGKAGIGTNTPNYPLTVSNNAFKTMEVNRIGTDANNFYASGTVYSITHPTTGFRGEYAYAYAGASTIATTTESQAVGYYAIDVANLGIFGTETANGPSGATFYMDPNKTFFQNTNLGIGTTSPSWLMTVAEDIPIATMTLNPMDAQLVISGKTNTGTLKFGSYYTNTGIPQFGTAIQSSYITAGYDVGSSITLNPLGGNVGIATTNPSQLFHVMGAIATDAGAPYGLLRLIASNNATFIQSGLSGATGSAAPLYFASMNSGSIWASISATGMMGIGTASSTIPLQVNNNAGTYSTPAASISDGPADLGGTYGMLHLTRPGASSDNKAHISIIRAGFRVFSIGYFSGTDTVGFVSANNMNSSNGMFIMSTGFTGIGTFTPQSKFHVYNGVTILSSGTTNNNAPYATPTTLHLRGPAATSTQLVWECVNINTAAITAGTGYGLSYGTQGGDHVFRTNCTYNGDFSATGSERFRIAANGNVGINSSVPGYNLDVVGTGHVTGTLNVDGLLTAGSFNIIPAGIIVMYSGDTIPAGWGLCDGTAGRPDMRNRFVVGAGATYGIRSIAGATSTSITLGYGNMPQHRHIVDNHQHYVYDHAHYMNAHGHGVSDPGHSHVVGHTSNWYVGIENDHRDFDAWLGAGDRATTTAYTGISIAAGGDGNTNNGGAQWSSASAPGTSYEGSGSAFSVAIIPPYYAVYYIIKL